MLLIIDDIVDSGGTLCNAAEELIKQGATDVSAYITHGVLSGQALERIVKSKLNSLVITNSICKTNDEIIHAPNIKILSVAELLGEAIARTAGEESVSSLFI